MEFGRKKKNDLPLAHMVNVCVSLFFDIVLWLCVMQTDPNWSNFLYDESKKRINLIDFGAARGYPKSFVDDYLRMVIVSLYTFGYLVVVSPAYA